VLKQVEQAPELRKRYIRAFPINDEHEPDLNCEARRETGALERLIDDVFGGDRKNTPDTVGPERRNIFDQLFKKKD